MDIGVEQKLDSGMHANSETESKAEKTSEELHKDRYNAQDIRSICQYIHCRD
jgi:hypothetical protein